MRASWWSGDFASISPCSLPAPTLRRCQRIVDESHTQVHDEVNFFDQPLVACILLNIAHYLLMDVHDCLHGTCSFLPGSLSAKHKGRPP